MPRNVRNFWLEGSIDGRSSKISGGPQGKDGGFELSVLMRDKGEVVEALDVRGYAENGRLVLWVRKRKDDASLRIETVR